MKNKNPKCSKAIFRFLDPSFQRVNRPFDLPFMLLMIKRDIQDIIFHLQK